MNDPASPPNPALVAMAPADAPAATCWHAGEQALQQRVGSLARLATAGPRVLRDHLPDEHREFFAELAFLLTGHVDAQGQPWATIVAGPRGFVQSPTPQRLRVQALPLVGEPLADALVAGAPIGLLGIQPHTRRRNRMNGWIEAVDGQGWTVGVGQSFGNCPKYIQGREGVPAVVAPHVMAPVSDRLDAAAQALVRRADTFFIATAHPAARHSRNPSAGVDVSHRGGPAGFLRLVSATQLLVPDYLGNAFFNTLGNLALEPRCGLLFLDFRSGDRLQVAARASLQWEGPHVDAVPGAQRLLRFEIDAVRRAKGGLPLAWR